MLIKKKSIQLLPKCQSRLVRWKFLLTFILGVNLSPLAWDSARCETISGTIYLNNAPSDNFESKNNKEVVLYLEPFTKRQFPIPALHAEIDQKNMEFIPHVLAVQLGATVDFLNEILFFITFFHLRIVATLIWDDGGKAKSEVILLIRQVLRLCFVVFIPICWLM